MIVWSGERHLDHGAGEQRHRVAGDTPAALAAVYTYLLMSIGERLLPSISY
jgi:hypothetical protein